MNIAKKKIFSDYFIYKKYKFFLIYYKEQIYKIDI